MGGGGGERMLGMLVFCLDEKDGLLIVALLFPDEKSMLCFSLFP